MKNLTTILTILVAKTLETFAQIPNGGFETWENYNDGSNVYQKPDKWNGSLPYSSTTHSFSIEKNPESFPAGTGQYSMKIKPDIANGVRGVAISNDGSDPMTGWIPKPSFAINKRPASLFLYYKCLPFGGDTIICLVYFYKNGVVIGNPNFATTQTVSNWTPLQVPMTFNTADIPDSATILFVTGAYIQHSESILYVDNLSFDGFATSIPENISKNIHFNLYPNPSSDFITIAIENRNSDNLIWNIYSITGSLVKSETLKQSQQQIDIGDLSNGIYWVEIKSKEWVGNKKLIIQR